MPTVAATVGGVVLSKTLNKPDTSAQRGQTAANERAQAFIESQAQQAQQTGEALFSGAEGNILAGNEAAYALLRQLAPQRINACQQGNIGAQQQLISGLPQVQAALMGRPIDYSALQPYQQQVNMTPFGTQMPQFTTSQEALGGMREQQAGYAEQERQRAELAATKEQQVAGPPLMTDEELRRLRMEVALDWQDAPEAGDPRYAQYIGYRG